MQCVKWGNASQCARRNSAEQGAWLAATPANSTELVLSHRLPTWHASTPPVRIPTHIMRGVSWPDSSWLQMVWLITRISAFCKMLAPLPARTEEQFKHTAVLSSSSLPCADINLCASLGPGLCHNPLFPNTIFPAELRHKLHVLPGEPHLIPVSRQTELLKLESPICPFPYSHTQPQIHCQCSPPSTVAPHPVTHRSLPTGNWWVESGRQMGWTTEEKVTGLCSSITAIS